LLIDVVCGTEFDPALTAFATVHEGRPYRFCSLACQHQFEAHPGRYAARADELSTSRS
jgi:YHS domain-containing protein